MMQLMHEIAELQAEEATEAHGVISAVRRRPGHGMQHGIENNVDRVTRDDEIYRQIGIQEQVLDRVHRVPRPGPGIDVLVVPGMKPAIQRLDMTEAVIPVEVEPAPDRDDQHQADEPGGIRLERDQRRVAVGISPQQQAFP